MSLIDFASLVGFNVGPYRLKQLLGRGAMGAVYLGWDGAARRLHAVKVLRPELAIDDAYLQRFFQEAEIGSSIRHDNLVRIHRGGMDDVITPRGQLLELPWLCMDFISGTSVSKHVGEGGKLEPLMAAEVIRHVLVGVGFAHSKGLLHGDVKPDNIMVSSDGTVMLADFGLARRMGSGATEGNSLSGGLEVLGTPYFMPPELWAGAADVDPRADLFSVGASFYRLLTGRPPFPGTNPSEVLHRLLSADADPVNSLNPAVDAQLSGIVMRMLSRRRDDRYRSAEEAGKMVQMWISSQKDADETGLWAALVAMGAGHAMDIDDLTVEPATKKLPAGASAADPRPDDPSKTVRVPVGEKLLGAAIEMTRTSNPVVMPKPTLPAPAPATSAPAVTSDGGAVDINSIPMGQTLESLPADLLDAVAAAGAAERAAGEDDFAETKELKTPALDLATKHLDRVSPPPAAPAASDEDDDLNFDEMGDFGETMEMQTPSLALGSGKPDESNDPASSSGSSAGLDGLNLEALDELTEFQTNAAEVVDAPPPMHTPQPHAKAVTSAKSTPPASGVPEDPSTTFAALAAIDAALRKAGGGAPKNPPRATRRHEKPATPPITAPVPPPPAASDDDDVDRFDQPGMQTLAALDTIGELMKEESTDESKSSIPIKPITPPKARPATPAKAATPKAATPAPSGELQPGLNTIASLQAIEDALQGIPASTPPPAAAAPPEDHSRTEQIEGMRGAFRSSASADEDISETVESPAPDIARLASRDKQTRQVDGMRILTPGKRPADDAPKAPAGGGSGLVEWTDDATDNLSDIAKLDEIAETARRTREDMERRETERREAEERARAEMREKAETARRQAEERERRETQRQDAESARHEFVKAATRRLVAIEQQSKVGGLGRFVIVLMMLGLIGGAVYVFQDQIFPPPDNTTNTPTNDGGAFDEAALKTFVHDSLTPTLDSLIKRLRAEHPPREDGSVPPQYVALERDFRLWLMLCGDVALDARFIETTLNDARKAAQLPPDAAGNASFSHTVGRDDVRASDWKQPLDKELARKVSDELASAVWTPRVTARLLGRGGDTGPTTLATLLPASSNTSGIKLSGGTTVSGFHHPAAWTSWARTAVEVATEAEVRQFGRSAGSYGPAASSVIGKVETAYLDSFRKAWIGFLDSIRMSVPPDLPSATDALGVFSDYSSSPLRTILDLIRSSDVLPPTARGDNADWIKDSVAALSELQITLHRFRNDTLSGERFLKWHDDGKLPQLQGAFDSASKGVERALSPIADPNFGKAIHGLFMRTMESVRRALAREATAELSGAWQPVLRDFRANVASGWPFDAQSNTDASLDRVIDMLHPASGALWNVANMATTMSGLQLGGSPLVTLTPGYVTAIGNARLLTDRLFGGENRATVPRLSGSVMLRTRSGASDIALTINGKRLELRPGRRVNFEWSADGGTCRLDADSQSVDGGNGPWALIRLLGEAESADVDTRRTQFTFHPASGMTITMILETATAGNPFKADLFSRVVLPDAICVPPVGDDE